LQEEFKLLPIWNRNIKIRITWILFFGFGWYKLFFQGVCILGAFVIFVLNVTL